MRKLFQNKWALALVALVVVMGFGGYLLIAPKAPVETKGIAFDKSVQARKPEPKKEKEKEEEPPPAPQLEVVGTVSQFKGLIFSENKDLKRTLASGDPIFQGDRITTGKKARLIIHMKDDAVIALGEDSEFHVQQYQFSPESGTGNGILELTKGLIKFASGKLAQLKQRPFQVVTPVATLGVRGTLGFAELLGPAGDDQTIEVITLEKELVVWMEEPNRKGAQSSGPEIHFGSLFSTAHAADTSKPPQSVTKGNMLTGSPNSGSKVQKAPKEKLKKARGSTAIKKLSKKARKKMAGKVADAMVEEGLAKDKAEAEKMLAEQPEIVEQAIEDAEDKLQDDLNRKIDEQLDRDEKIDGLKESLETATDEEAENLKKEIEKLESESLDLEAVTSGEADDQQADQAMEATSGNVDQLAKDIAKAVADGKSVKEALKGKADTIKSEKALAAQAMGQNLDEANKNASKTREEYEEESGKEKAGKEKADKAEADKAEAEKTESEKAEAEKTESEKAESEKAESEKAEADKAEADKAAAEKETTDQETETTDDERARKEQEEADRLKAEQEAAQRLAEEQRKAQEEADKGQQQDEDLDTTEDNTTLPVDTGGGTSNDSDTNTNTSSTPIVSNHTPTVSGGPFFVKERSSRGTPVGTVTVVDEDINQTHSFSLTGSSSFAIGSNGQITVAIAQLPAGAATHSLSVTVTDSGVQPESATATVIVNVNELTIDELIAALEDELEDAKKILDTLKKTGTADDIKDGENDFELAQEELREAKLRKLREEGASEEDIAKQKAKFAKEDVQAAEEVLVALKSSGKATPEDIATQEKELAERREEAKDAEIDIMKAQGKSDAEIAERKVELAREDQARIEQELKELEGSGTATPAELAEKKREIEEAKVETEKEELKKLKAEGASDEKIAAQETKVAEQEVKKEEAELASLQADPNTKPADIAKQQEEVAASKVEKEKAELNQLKEEGASDEKIADQETKVAEQKVKEEEAKLASLKADPNTKPADIAEQQEEIASSKVEKEEAVLNELEKNGASEAEQAVQKAIIEKAMVEEEQTKLEKMKVQGADDETIAKQKQKVEEQDEDAKSEDTKAENLVLKEMQEAGKSEKEIADKKLEFEREDLAEEQNELAKAENTLKAREDDLKKLKEQGAPQEQITALENEVAELKKDVAEQRVETAEQDVSTKEAVRDQLQADGASSKLIAEQNLEIAEAKVQVEEEKKKELIESGASEAEVAAQDEKITSAEDVQEKRQKVVTLEEELQQMKDEGKSQEEIDAKQKEVDDANKEADEASGDSPDTNEAPSLSDISSLTILEDKEKSIEFTVTDPDSSLSDIEMTAESSLPELIAEANIIFTGTGKERTVTLTPEPDQFGETTIKITATDDGSPAESDTVEFKVTVTAVGEAPTVASVSTEEDKKITTGLTITPTSPDGDEVTHFKIDSLTSGTLHKAGGTEITDDNSFITREEGAAGLLFTPAENATADVTFNVYAATDGDGGGLSSATTATITVTAVADLPSVPSTATTDEDVKTGENDLIVSRNEVDGDEVTHFKITDIANGTLYEQDGTIQISIKSDSFYAFTEGKAQLRFEPEANKFEEGSFKVWAATDDQGSGLSGSVTVTITVNAVAETPSISSITATEDEQATGLTISRSSDDGDEVTHFKIDSLSSGTLYKADGTEITDDNSFITREEGAAGLLFTPAEDSTADVTFNVHAATDGEGSGLSPAATATITVTEVPDLPAVTSPTTDEDVQTGENDLVISRNAVDSDEVTHFKVTDIANGTLYEQDGKTAINSDTFYAFEEGQAYLRFTPEADKFEDGSFKVWAATDDQGSDLSGSSTATITVNAVADTPSITSASTTVNQQTTSGLEISRNSADGEEVSHFQITGITNGTLYKDDDTVIENDDFITFAEGNAGLKFTPATDVTSDEYTIGFTIQAATSNNIDGLGGETVTTSITVTPINAGTPTVTSAETNEDTQTSSGLQIDRNSSDGSEVTHFKITDISNGTLYQNDGSTAISAGEFITYDQGNAGLRFTPDANSIADGSFQVWAATSDSGDGLSDSSATATITIIPVADTPSISSATTNEDTQSTSGLEISRNSNDDTEVTHFQITNITNGTLYKNDGTTSIANDEYITFSEGSSGLKFTPDADVNSDKDSDIGFSIQASTSENSSGLGGDVVTASITVTAVADTPSVTTASTDEDTQSSSGLKISRNSNDSTEVTHFKITDISNGTLYKNDGSTAISADDFITYDEGNAGLKFTPDADSISDGSFQIWGATSNSGDGLSDSSATATITINPVADTPSITDATMDEDTQSTSGLVISRNSADSSEVTHFKITGISGGALYHSDGSTAISDDDFITYSQGNNGLKFTPTTDTNSNTNTAGFTIQASTADADSGLGGSTVDAVITVDPINDAPVNTVPDAQSTTEDVSITFSDGNGNPFSFTDDASEDGSSVQVTLSVSNGTLTVTSGTSATVSNDGTATVTISGTVSQVNSALATVTYAPTADYNGSDTLTMTTSDLGNAGSGDTETDTDTVDITITAVADAPTVTSASTTEDTQTTSGLVIDRNSNDDTEVTHFKITNILNGSLFQNDGTTAISENAFITYNEAIAGLRFTPDAELNDTNTTEGFSFDIAGATSSNGDGLSDTTTATIAVSAVNDAPVLDNTQTPTFSAIDEDIEDASNSGNTVAAIVVDDSITDVEVSNGEATSIEAIAVITVDNTNGVWKYTTDGSTWLKFSETTGASVDISSAARLLAWDDPSYDDKIRFEPNTDYSGTATLTYRAWDMSSGSQGSTMDATTVGGSTPFSSASETVSITVNAVNDAPVLTASSPTLTAIDEDVASASNGGKTISSIVANGDITDVDVDTVPEAIAVTTVDNTIGFWQYTTDGGTTWSDFSATTGSSVDIETSSRLLDGDDANHMIRFNPDADQNGSATLTYRAWDKTSGTAGSVADSSTNGDETAYSTGTDTLTVTINAVNDAPVNSYPASPSTDEDTDLTLSGSNLISISDVDESETGSAEMEVDLSITNGTLTLSGNSGLTFTTGDGTSDSSMVFTGTRSDINTALASMVFTPTADYPGSSENANTGTAVLTITSSDQGNTGSGGTLTDTDTINITVNAIGDAPTITSASTTEEVQTTSGLVIDRNGNDGTEIDFFQISGITNGTLYKNDGTTEITNGTFITYDEGQAGLKFTPDAELSNDGDGNSGSTFTFNVYGSTDSSGTGLGGDAGTPTITVTAVNDAPTDISLSNQGAFKGAQGGSAIGLFTATDPDVTAGGTDSFVFSITSQVLKSDDSTVSLFDVRTDSRDGMTDTGNQLVVASGETLSTATTYTITVSVTDDGGAGSTISSPVSFDIEVIDSTVTSAATAVNTDDDTLKTNGKAKYQTIFDSLYDGTETTVTNDDFETLILGKLAQQLDSGGELSGKSVADFINTFDVDIESSSSIKVRATLGYIEALYDLLEASDASTETEYEAIFDTLAPYTTNYTVDVEVTLVPTVDNTAKTVAIDTSNSTVSIIHLMMNNSFSVNLSTLIDAYNNILSALKTAPGVRMFTGGGAGPPTHIINNKVGHAATAQDKRDEMDSTISSAGIDNTYDNATSRTVPTSQRFDYYFPGMINSITISSGQVTLTP